MSRSGLAVAIGLAVTGLLAVGLWLGRPGLSDPGPVPEPVAPLAGIRERLVPVPSERPAPKPAVAPEGEVETPALVPRDSSSSSSSGTRAEPRVLAPVVPKVLPRTGTPTSLAAGTPVADSGAYRRQDAAMLAEVGRVLGGPVPDRVSALLVRAQSGESIEALRVAAKEESDLRVRTALLRWLDARTPPS